MATYHWFRTIVIGEKLCPFAPPFQRQPKLMRIVSVSSPTTTNRRQAVESIRQEVLDLVGTRAETSSSSSSSSPTTTTTPTATTMASPSSTTHTKESSRSPMLQEEQQQQQQQQQQQRRQQHETTLVILDLPEWSKDFREFVRFSWDVQEQVIEQGNWSGILQLVLFHPLATHQTYSDSSSNDNHHNAGDYTIRSPYPTIHLLREMDVLRAVQGGYPHLETLPARNQAKMVQQGVDICQARLKACYQVVVHDDKRP